MNTFIRTTIFALLALLSFSSCINDDDNITTQNEEIAINLIVSLGPTQKTRAYSSETDAIGNEYFINVKPTVQDFELLVYNTNGTLRTKAVIESATQLDYNTYKLKGKFYTFKESDLNQKYKFVVIANSKGGSCQTRSFDWLATGNEANLYSQLRYDYNNAETFTENILKVSDDNVERIPMWGSLTEELENGGNLKINLVRAMAKVTVCTASGLDKTIESVKLVGYNNAGMLTPTNAADNQNTYEVNSSNGKDELNAPADAFVNAELPFTTYEKNGTTYHCLYIPEQAADADSKIVVTIDGEDYELRFANYDASHNSSNPGNRYPVLRNNWYNYVINSVSPKGLDLNLQYYVADWNPKTATDITFD